MKLKLYAVHDSAVKEFIGPEAARTHGEAERKFKMNVNNPENQLLHTNPENFGLYCIGEYDSETGLLAALKEPQHIVTAIQVKETASVAGRIGA